MEESIMRSLFVGLVILGMVGTVYAQDPWQDCTVDFTLQFAGGATHHVYDPEVAGSESFTLEIWCDWDYAGGVAALAGADCIPTASESNAVKIVGPLPSTNKSGDHVAQDAYDTTDYVAPYYPIWDTQIISPGTALDFTPGNPFPPEGWPLDPAADTVGSGATAPINAAYDYYYHTTGTGTISDTHVRLAWIEMEVMPAAAHGQTITITPELAGMTMQVGTDPQNLKRIYADTENGVTIELVPEPATALLLIGALPFLRRRR
jgi:hypothetical protein